MTERRSARALVLCLAATALFTVADLGSKAWAESTLSRQRSEQINPACTPDAGGYYAMQRQRAKSITLVDGYLELRYAENCGAAFGMLNQAPKWVRVSVFMTAGAVAVVSLMWMFAAGNGGPLFAWSVPLIVSGAIGNMYDRIQLGYVIDFIRFHTHETWEWPTFNIADATITVGVVLLLLDGLLHRAPATAATDSARAEQPSPKSA
jgi:signal peptidase II